MGMRLSDVQLSILHDARTEGRFTPSSRFEQQQAESMVTAGYLEKGDGGIYMITQLGCGALKGQGGL